MSLKLKILLIMIGSILSLSSCNSVNNATLQPETIQVASTPKNTKAYFLTAKYLIFKYEEIARKWDISANLVKAEAKDVDEKGMAYWTYYYQSPYKDKILKIDSSLNSMEIDSFPFNGREITNRNWKVDSDKAIMIAQQQGLQIFPVEEMFLEDRFIDPEWELRSLYGYYRINALTGTVTKVQLRPQMKATAKK